jgi:hypothetical protein
MDETREQPVRQALPSRVLMNNAEASESTPASVSPRNFVSLDGASRSARKASVWTGNAIATAMDDIQACGTLGHRHLDSRGTAEESPAYAPA